MIQVMELAQLYYDPYDKRSAITICDANVATYLAGRHNILHICFLKDLQQVPIMGLASYSYRDIWDVDISSLENYYAPFNFGNHRLPKSLESGGVSRGDTVQVEFQFRSNELYVRIGKNRSDWTRWLCSNFDDSIKISFVVESPKENFVIVRDDLYLDYLMNGPPRNLRHCGICGYDRDRIVIAQCGHYLCTKCWKGWFETKTDMLCCVCNKRIERHIIAKFRDSPCPIDHCRSGDTEHDYVLVPCGCVVRCVIEYEGKATRCPYEPCNKPVEEKWILYEH
ncbi:hypothetical protein NECAME_11188 [Necator americanus]|uniref:RING-type domain-containing protein n=1 Tax=Necator americanus TaxID=51031 RepID=W2T5I8_NECAM|nr:hypothetical protein NECAME_11188 [Necator americanus]ETN77255.1 hypothetical protein NECAME_11188 [Necator americanus]